MTTISKIIAAGLFACVWAGCGEELTEIDTDINTGNQDSETELSVDTDTTGLLVVDPTSGLEGRTYLIDFNPDYWTSPKDVGAEIGAYVPAFMFQITSVTDDTFTALLGTASEDGTQNMCNKTMEVTGTLDDNPHFMLDAVDYEAIVTGNELSVISPIYGFSIGGAFVDQGVSLKRGEVNALMDFRDIAPLFHLLSEEHRTAEDICAMMIDELNYECEVCPFESTVSLCVTLKASMFKAYEVDVDLQAVAQTDASCL